MSECHSKYAGKRTMSDVEVNLTSYGVPMVLVVSAYNPVRWKINNAGSVKLMKVLVGGYHTQEIHGIPANVPIEAFTYETPLCSTCTRGNGYFMAYKEGTPEFDSAAQIVRDSTGLHAISFQGAYKARRFNVIGGRPSDAVVSPTADYVGRSFTNEVRIDGRAIALPSGRWTALVHSSKQSSRGSDTLAAFAKMDDQRMLELYAVRVQSARDGQGFPTFQGCKSNDPFKRQIDANESFGQQSCFEVVNASEPWKQALFAAASTKASAMGAGPKNIVIASNFHRANSTGSLDIVRYAIPEESIAGIDTEWHPTRLSSDPAKAQFVQEQVKWTEAWAQIVNQIKY